ncbi:MAG: T9SS type A sorting domain-containing protein [Flavobacterium sp.]|nr:T9SS type A sorting domain-containing protein [Flavobacterium sp.]
MKKKYFSLLFICLSAWSFGQIVNIPDANFKSRLISTNCAQLTSPAWLTDVDTNNDGEIQVSEAQNVLELDVSTNQFNAVGDIFSMEGIEAFSNLSKLNCGGNNFSSLDVSMLSALIDVNCDKSHVHFLNVAGLTNLEILNCNFNSLTNIDLSGLTSLLSFNCVINALTTLNVSDAQGLTNFQCDQNQITTLILGDKPALRTLRCGGNPITTINPQLFPNIEYLNCSNTLITSIDLNGLSVLTSLQLDATLLSEIDCSQTGLSYHLDCSDNPNLTSINVRNNRLPMYDPDMLDFPFHLENLPNLTSLCMDDGEQNLLVWTNYNANGNVQVFGGPNCDIPLEINANGTSDFDLKNTVSLYPIPAKNTINITTASEVNIQSISIYTTLGQLVKTLEAYDLSSSLPIDVSSLRPGTYFMEINANAGKTTKKFVKL